MDKRETCIKIMEIIGEWTDEHGFETSVVMEHELALWIWNEAIEKDDKKESGEAIQDSVIREVKSRTSILRQIKNA